jgi:hypothetical protein
VLGLQPIEAICAVEPSGDQASTEGVFDSTPGLSAERFSSSQNRVAAVDESNINLLS